MTDGVNNVELLKRSKYELDSFLTITSDNHKRTDELVAFHFLQGPRNCISASLSHEAIDEAQIASSMFLNSQFKMAEEQMASCSDRSMYHATFMFIKAIMSYEKGDMTAGLEAIRNATAVVERSRRRHTITDQLLMMASSVAKKHYTDEEMHAEVLMFRAVLTFLSDDNFSSFLLGALKIHACFQSYKECHRILHTFDGFASDSGSCGSDGGQELKRQFESGVRMGIGAFNLLLSTLPARLLRLLEVCGFSGNRATGMMELQFAALIPNTLRTTMAALSLLSWHLFVTYVIGIGQPDLALCRKLLQPLTERYPNVMEFLKHLALLQNAIVLFLRARLHLITGSVDNAIFFYHKSIRSQNVYCQFHHACYWELLFAYAFRRRWDRAANQAKRLLDESRWWTCVYTYLLAVLINADLTAPKRLDTVKLLFGRISTLRLRIAGKSIPIEKFCERKASRFQRRDALYWPHYASRFSDDTSPSSH